MTLPIIGTAAVLAGDMLSFLVSMYENASTDSERLDIILRYSTVMRDLQRAINKEARARERKLCYPGSNLYRPEVDHETDPAYCGTEIH